MKRHLFEIALVNMLHTKEFIVTQQDLHQTVLQKREMRPI